MKTVCVVLSSLHMVDLFYFVLSKAFLDGWLKSREKREKRVIFQKG